MKKLKKIAALMLAMVMTVAMAVPAFAETTNFSITTDSTETKTVTNAADVTVSGIALETESLSAYKFLNATYENGVVTYSLASWAEQAIKNYTGTDSDVKDCQIKENNTVTGVNVETVIQKLGGRVKVTGGQADNTGENGDNDDAKATNALLTVIANAVGNNEADQTIVIKNDDANKITTTQFEEEQDEEGNVKSYKATFKNLAVGSYVVLAKDTTNVYNSMQISVGLTADADGKLNGVKANNTVAKYTEVPFDKEIVVAEKDKHGNSDANDYQVGDTINYKLTNTIPNYDLNAYKNIKYTITDTMASTLDPCDAGGVKVKIGEREITLKKVNDEDDENKTYAKYEYTEKGENKETTIVTVDKGTHTITVNLEFFVTAEYLNKEVEITYTATLNKTANTGFDPNTNTAVLEYSNDPNNKESTNKKEDETNTYTFTIDGNILAKGAYKLIGHEVKKTGVDEWSTEKTESDIIYSEYAALEGATFELCTEGTDGKLVAVGGITNTVKSAADGRISFTGLKGDTTYYLRETVAPSGYSVNETVYAIKFVPIFDADGEIAQDTDNDSKTMTAYEVWIGSGTDITNLEASTKLVTYSIDDYTKNNPSVTVKYKTKKGTVTTTDGETEYIETTEIRNTQLASLPSTGGAGTTIFTVAGCVIMIAAAGMFILSRRKKNA